MPWRTEPEIDEERQRFLTERRAILPNVEKGVYSFKDIKLDRADVEWLLATHESDDIRGPVDWSDDDQRERRGLDLRGADLRGVSLQELPLSCSVFGLLLVLPNKAIAMINLENPLINLEDPLPSSGKSELAVPIMMADEDKAQHSSFAGLVDVGYIATEHDMDLAAAHLERANLTNAHVENSSFVATHLEGATLRKMHAELSNFTVAYLTGSDLVEADLRGANLRRAHFSDKTVLASTLLNDVTCADVHWNGVSLALIDWVPLTRLGDEQQAGQAYVDIFTLRSEVKGRTRKSAERRRNEFRAAVRANRQLSTALRDQGLNEDADRFAYRAQFLQRQVFRRQKQWARYIGSLLLDLISGYGYRPRRSLFTYLLTIGGFAAAYFFISLFLLAPVGGPALSPLDAVVFSMTSFHGRGFTPGENIGLSNPLTILAAIEAFIGLLIEITFIATFTQRFFAR
jgi:uncharacterized protein YjbI with pentapeptide repeats